MPTMTDRPVSVCAADIEHTAQIVHERFATGRIRDFIPLPVETAARRDPDNHHSAASDAARPGESRGERTFAPTAPMLDQEH